jgi:hypothetical protein
MLLRTGGVFVSKIHQVYSGYEGYDILDSMLTSADNKNAFRSEGRFMGHLLLPHVAGF